MHLLKGTLYHYSLKGDHRFERYKSIIWYGEKIVGRRKYGFTGSELNKRQLMDQH